MFVSTKKLFLCYCTLHHTEDRTGWCSGSGPDSLFGKYPLRVSTRIL